MNTQLDYSRVFAYELRGCGFESRCFENETHLQITEIILVRYNIATNIYQQELKGLYTVILLF